MLTYQHGLCPGLYPNPIKSKPQKDESNPQRALKTKDPWSNVRESSLDLATGMEPSWCETLAGVKHFSLELSKVVRKQITIEVKKSKVFPCTIIRTIFFNMISQRLTKIALSS